MLGNQNLECNSSCRYLSVDLGTSTAPHTHELHNNLLPIRIDNDSSERSSNVENQFRGYTSSQMCIFQDTIALVDNHVLGNILVAFRTKSLVHLLVLTSM